MCETLTLKYWSVDLKVCGGMEYFLVKVKCVYCWVLESRLRYRSVLWATHNLRKTQQQSAVSHKETKDFTFQWRPQIREMLHTYCVSGPCFTTRGIVSPTHRFVRAFDLEKISHTRMWIKNKKSCGIFRVFLDAMNHDRNKPLPQHGKLLLCNPIWPVQRLNVLFWLTVAFVGCV